MRRMVVAVVITVGAASIMTVGCTARSPHATSSPPAQPTVASSSTSTTAPTTTELSAEPTQFGDFAGNWYWHGQGVSIGRDGTGTATWRVYKWCTDDPQPPCDGMSGSNIIDGGKAAFVLHRRDGATAYGTVLQSSDGGTVPVGDIALVLLPRDHLQFPGLGDGPLCGPTAPSDCGA